VWVKPAIGASHNLLAIVLPPMERGVLSCAASLDKFVVDSFMEAVRRFQVSWVAALPILLLRMGQGLRP